MASNESEYRNSRYNQEWFGALERLSTATIASDLYDAVVSPGMSVVVQGPMVWPQDSVGLELCYRVGVSGTVCSVDTQGSVHKKGHGIGSAIIYQQQVEEFARMGMDVGPFQWLGTQFDFTQIPKHIAPVHVVADHGLVEFFKGRRTAAYMRKGIVRSIESLGVGGWYIHQGLSEDFFSSCIGRDTIPWLSQFGVRITTMNLERDEYRMTIPWEVGRNIEDSGMLEKHTQIEYGEDHTEATLIIYEEAIAHPRHWVLLAQKIR